jgi:hypothetical protein
MGNTLAPLTGSLYPIIYSNDTKGGFHQSLTIADRNAIPALRRQLGMLCTVLDAGSGTPVTYQLLGGLLDANWVVFASSAATSGSFVDLTNKPTTLAGYGITDALTTTQAANGITGTDITNWNTAYGWGNHAGLYRPIGYVPTWSEITSNPFSFASLANDQLLKYNSASGQWENWTPNYLTSSSGLSSIAGTVNQITASSSTGAVTLSLPATIAGLTSITATEFIGALNGNATTATTAGSYTGNMVGDVTGTQGATVVGKVNGKNIILGGDLTTSGAFATILTSTASTAVTLPTTGVLATLGGAESITGVKTFNNGMIAILGSSTGTTTVSTSNATTVNNTITLPATTGTIALTSDIASVAGVLYKGIVADLSTFNGLNWSNIIAGNNLGTSIPNTICSLDPSSYTWIAFPKAWGTQNFFYLYGSPTAIAYAVLDGFEKRIIPAATTGSIDYQVWVFKTTPDIAVSLIVNNNN